MIKGFLPEKGTDKLIAEYPTASDEQLELWAKEYGYKNKTSFITAMRQRLGVLRASSITEMPLEVKIERIPYPNFKIKPFKVAKGRRDEEDICIIISDPHIDKITESYNLQIAQSRFDYLLDSAMTIINLHRPIRKAHIFALGDIVQGENPYQGSKGDEIENAVIDQIDKKAVPMLSRFITTLAQGVEGVDFYGVRGNHGRYSKEATDKTNWDVFVYRALARGLEGQKNIGVYSPNKFYQLINIKGFRFFIVHGDQVCATQGIPLFAMRRKMQEWYAYVGGFNYAYAGHFHSGAYDQVNSMADYTISPPLVTGDSWALEKVGRASVPQQLCFGIHKKYGRTFTYHLHTDEKFLPKRYDEPEGVVVI